MSGEHTPVSEAITMAVINAWENISHAPFPLYNSEASAIGRAVIDANDSETVAELRMIRADRDHIMADRDRLRDEVERLLKYDRDAIAVCDSYAEENQQLSDRIDALIAEVANLKHLDDNSYAIICDLRAEVASLQSLAANAALNGCVTTIDAANEANSLRAEVESLREEIKELNAALLHQRNLAEFLRAEKAELIAALSNMLGVCGYDNHPAKRVMMENADVVLSEAIAADMKGA